MNLSIKICFCMQQYLLFKEDLSFGFFMHHICHSSQIQLSNSLILCCTCQIGLLEHPLAQGLTTYKSSCGSRLSSLFPPYNHPFITLKKVQKYVIYNILPHIFYYLHVCTTIFLLTNLTNSLKMIFSYRELGMELVKILSISLHSSSYKLMILLYNNLPCPKSSRN